MRYFFRVEYDGTPWSGWQRQPNVPSIQEALEKAFGIVLRMPCPVTGAGRTDAGVHAKGQGAHIETTSAIDTHDIEHSVNSILPPSVAIYHLQKVDDSFHARFSALSRRYCYTISTRKQPLLYNRAWPVLYTLNWAAMEESVAQLVGEHDFATFCSKGSDIRHARCTVVRTSIIRYDERILFTIEANRFVYNMVRALTGTIIDIGREHCIESMLSLLERKDRSFAGATAPAWGLTLENVTYHGVD